MLSLPFPFSCSFIRIFPFHCFRIFHQYFFLLSLPLPSFIGISFAYFLYASSFFISFVPSSSSSPCFPLSSYLHYLSSSFINNLSFSSLLSRLPHCSFISFLYHHFFLSLSFCHVFHILLFPPFFINIFFSLLYSPHSSFFLSLSPFLSLSFPPSRFLFLPLLSTFFLSPSYILSPLSIYFLLFLNYYFSLIPLTPFSFHHQHFLSLLPLSSFYFSSSFCTIYAFFIISFFP